MISASPPNPCGWATCWPLLPEPAEAVAEMREPAKAAAGVCTPIAHGDGAGVQRKRLLWRPWPSRHQPLNIGDLLLWWTQASSVNILGCGHATLQPLQAFSVQPTPVFSPPQVCPLNPELQHPGPTRTSGQVS